MERKSDLIPINICKRATRVVESIENYQSRIGSGLSCLEAHVVHEERQYCCLHCYTFSLVQLRQIDSVDPGNPATPITPPPFYTYTFSLSPLPSPIPISLNSKIYKQESTKLASTLIREMKKILLSNLESTFQKWRREKLAYFLICEENALSKWKPKTVDRKKLLYIYRVLIYSWNIFGESILEIETNKAISSEKFEQQQVLRYIEG